MLIKPVAGPPIYEFVLMRVAVLAPPEKKTVPCACKDTDARNINDTTARIFFINESFPWSVQTQKHGPN